MFQYSVFKVRGGGGCEPLTWESISFERGSFVEWSIILFRSVFVVNYLLTTKPEPIYVSLYLPTNHLILNVEFE